MSSKFVDESTTQQIYRKRKYFYRYQGDILFSSGSIVKVCIFQFSIHVILVIIIRIRVNSIFLFFPNLPHKKVACNDSQSQDENKNKTNSNAEWDSSAGLFKMIDELVTPFVCLS